MPEFNIAGKVQTVTGPIEPEQMGLTLTHEHVLVDQSPFTALPDEASARQMHGGPVSQANLGYIRHHYGRSMDDGQVFDIEGAIEEVSLYRQFGGGSLIDVTSMGVARDPVALARISRATGVNIVMGGSYYQRLVHPPDMDDLSEDDLTARIVSDITQGADGTDIRSGVIGEVGCGWPLSNNERKAVRASGRAQRATGAPLLIHPGRDDAAPAEILSELMDVGADMSHTVMGHIERTVFQMPVLKEVAESGCYINWDLVGTESSYYSAYKVKSMPNDAAKMDQMAWLVSEGFGNRILIAQDLANKSRLMRYGGHGLCYIPAQIVPRMRGRGFSEEAVHRILFDNPAAAFTFSEPNSA
jgi:phosphotriesterase-related protein